VALRFGIGCKRCTYIIICGTVITQLHIRKVLENLRFALIAFHPMLKDYKTCTSILLSANDASHYQL